ncbi:anti-sigma factor domain-containing protein [Geobacillus sp. E263]|uniref:anti-sigma factor domain-containing protein n=1 Tax=Geobacillus sp. E263 TaxID=391290 RepID=UPI00117A3589|nr:anti-sigma factor domain-containing protein [Geobacillus sp. E263]
MKKGIVLELDEEFVTLLTTEGEFIQVKKDGDYEIGEEIEAQVIKRPIVRRRSFRYVITSLVAAVVLLVTTLFHFPSNEVYAYMSIDINPSIEVGVDEQLKVLKLKAYNEEGKRIVSQLSHWKKKEFVDITMEIIELSMQKGYLQEGGQVLITAVERKHRAASSRELSTELKKIQHSYQQKNIIVKTEESTMEVRNKAVKKGVTTGKLLQIEQKMKTVSPESTKAKKLEKPLEQNDGENEYPMDNHSLNKKDEKNQKKNKDNGNQKGEHRRNNHSLNEKDEKNRGNNHSLQKKDKQKREENNSNEKKYPFEEKDEQKKSNDKEQGENGKNHKSSAKNNKYHNSDRSDDRHLKHYPKKSDSQNQHHRNHSSSYDHHWKHHQKNNKQDEHHWKRDYDKNFEKSFERGKHEKENIHKNEKND